MKIKKGDKVLIIAGKDRNKTGKVLKAIPDKGKVVVENVNMAKKHQRSRKQGQKGQIVSLCQPLDVSNVMIICTKCAKATRIGREVVVKDNKRVAMRICRKCKAEI